MSVETVLSEMQSYSAELGLNLFKTEDRFKWFLASILFAKRILAETAKKTYRQFEKEELTTPERILEVGWDCLVEVLDAGGYTRYDFSTATNLLKTMQKLKEYGGLERLHEISKNPRDLERLLLEFKGIGPVGVNIFLRELRGIWKKAQPQPSKMATEIGQGLHLSLKDIERYESSLVRLNLEYCKKHYWAQCPMGRLCKDKPHSEK